MSKTDREKGKYRGPPPPDFLPIEITSTEMKSIKERVAIRSIMVKKRWKLRGPHPPILLPIEITLTEVKRTKEWVGS